MPCGSSRTRSRRGEDTDAMFHAIVWTKRDSLPERELTALEDLGPLAQRIFSRIATHEG